MVLKSVGIETRDTRFKDKVAQTHLIRNEKVIMIDENTKSGGCTDSLRKE